MPIPTAHYDLTVKLAEILVGLSKDNRPGMEAHHSRLDELKACLMADEKGMDEKGMDCAFSDDLLIAWNEMMEMKPEDTAKLAEETAP